MLFRYPTFSVNRPLLIMRSVVLMLGGADTPGSASNRRPRLSVTRFMTRQLSPTHNANCGRGVARLQFPHPAGLDIHATQFPPRTPGSAFPNLAKLCS